MEIHRRLSPGSLEAVYQASLAHELSLRAIWFEQFRRLPVTYKGVLVGEDVAGFVIEERIILELKAVSTLYPRHDAQALNSLTATGFRLALVLNPSTALRACFGAASLEHTRVVK
ncbi:MAG: GxxExxY protein [Ardenticatenaceae bacterium]|nr:GxxExxY protein [Ardenticatenaceae bacterium]